MVEKQDNQDVYDLLFKLGKVYLDKGQYNEAIEKFSKLIELGKENASIYINLSKAYLSKEQYDENAADIFRKLLEYDPENKIIIIVLSQIYLDNKREDKEAYRIYQKALKFHPKKTKDLILSLAKIDYTNGNYKAAKLLAEEYAIDYEELLPYYAQICWKENRLNELAKMLKIIYRKNHSSNALRWLMLNYLQAFRTAAIVNKKYQIELEDIRYCDNYLNSIKEFDQLDDIYIYLSLKKFIRDIFSEKLINDSQTIPEYALFLTDDSFSNIWDRGLNKQDSIITTFDFFQEIWAKLTPVDINITTCDIDTKQIYPNQDLNQFNTFILVKINNYDDLIHQPDHNEWFSKFEALIGNLLDTTSLRKIKDGYITLERDPIKAVEESINLSKSYSNGIQLKFDIIIHHHNSTNAEELLNELHILFEIQQLQDSIFNHVNSVKNTEIYNKIYVSETVYNLIKSNNSIDIKPLDNVHIPNLIKPLTIYKIKWEDYLDRIRKGIVNKISRFVLLEEMYLNEIFCSYKAIDTFLDRLLILKILIPDFQTNNQDKTSETFLEQARKIGKLNHKNIAIIYDVGKDEGYSYIAREYIEGKPITANFNLTDWCQVIKLFLQIGKALSYAHQLGIIHGRIKPTNIFVLETNEIKITDFSIQGFYKPLREQKNFELIGLSYASPEQINDANIDHRSDIYSLGVIFYELMTNGNPFYDDDKEKLLDNVMSLNPPPVSDSYNDIPNAIDNIIAKAIAKSPQERYKNIEQFMLELENFLVQSV